MMIRSLRKNTCSSNQKENRHLDLHMTKLSDSFSFIASFSILALVVSISVLYHQVFIVQRLEINSLQQQVDFHHQLFKQWFEYETNKRSQVQVRSRSDVSTPNANANSLELVLSDEKEFWETWIRKALPPGCEDEQFFKKWMITIDSYFWNRLSHGSEKIFVNCSHLGGSVVGSSLDYGAREKCTMFVRYLEGKMSNYHFVTETGTDPQPNKTIVLFDQLDDMLKETIVKSDGVKIVNTLLSNVNCLDLEQDSLQFVLHHQNFDSCGISLLSLQKVLL